MAIYAIADLHLSFSENKPMDIFGENWENYEEKLKENWTKKINKEDIVILPGDFSWAMKLEDTKKDFEYLNSLPRKKNIVKRKSRLLVENSKKYAGICRKMWIFRYRIYE